MKRFLAIALAASVSLVMAGSASAASGGTFAKAPNAYAAGDAANGIGISRHNLGGFGKHVISAETTEICIFCHTPHHTNQTDGIGPLWNRKSDQLTTFTAYGDTIGGSSIGTVLGPSLACLSCHDGVTTFDNLVNRPGKDLGSTANTWTFSEGGTDYLALTNLTTLPGYDDIPGDASTGDYALRHSGRLDIGGNGPNALAAGSGLSDDHPVGVAYAAVPTVASLRPTSTVISSIDLAYDLNATSIGSVDMTQNLWAVAGFISDTATIADLLRGGNVECGSCHDPHFSNASWEEVETTWTSTGDIYEGNGLFLRRVQGNSGSGVCRTCHEK
jgi:hypothetical protein